MVSLPSEIFESFLLLKSVDASNTRLSSIVNMRFSSLPNLVDLDLSHNSIITVPDRIFDRCNAKEVNLQQNKIRELSSSAFAGLTQLLNLDLSFNKIAKLDEDVFRPLISMNELRLDNNRIEVIDEKLFVHNSQLQMLYLNNNLISVVQAKAFESLKMLSALDIGDNLFPAINLMPMERLNNIGLNNGNLTTLEIPNHVTEVRAYGNQIAHIKIAIDSNLTMLMVGKNQLTTLGDLTKHKNLRKLELSYNKIEHLDLITFAKMPQLEQLLLYGIKLEKLDADFVLRNLLHLKVLELSPEFYKKEELERFTTKLKTIVVLNDGGKIINNQASTATNDPIPTKNVYEDESPLPETRHDANLPAAAKVNVETISDPDRQLLDRIQKLEEFIKSSDQQRAELKYKENIEESLHSLRMLIVVTLCAFSLFVSYQIFTFVRKNYTRLRIQTSTMLSNGRARSHEPMLEEVL